CLERVDLASVGVPSHNDVEGVQRHLIRPAVEHLSTEQDEARARRQRWHAAGQAFTQWLFESEHPHQAAHRGGLAAREDKCVHAIELVALPYRTRFGSGGMEGREVFTDVTLEGKNAYSENCRLTFSG